LNIDPENLPVHQITAVGIASASSSATTTRLGIQVECKILDYLSKDKPVELSVILFHPTGSRFTNQTTTIKRGSSIFFSGALSLVEDKLYLELQNFSFVRNNQALTSEKQVLPWSLKPTQMNKNHIPTPINTARSIHELNKKSSNSDNPVQTPAITETTKSTNDSNKELTPDDIEATKNSDDLSDFMEEPDSNSTPKTSGRYKKSDNVIVQDSDTIHKSLSKAPKRTYKPKPSPIPISTPKKRRTRSSCKTGNKVQKLADIATNIISVADTDVEDE
jgi:hypothetical protein